MLKSLGRLPKRDLVRIKKRVDALVDNLPDPATTKVKDNNSLHKIRSVNYRVIYEIHSDKLVILVVKIGHRKKVYQSLP